MSKQVNAMSLNQFIRHLGEYVTTKSDMRAMGAVLKEQAPKLTHAERVTADVAIVKHLANHYGCTPQKAVKNGVLSMLTFPRSGHTDPKTMALYARASSALSYARSEFLNPKIRAEVSPVERAKIALAKLLEDAEYASEAKRAVKHLMLLVK